MMAFLTSIRNETSWKIGIPCTEEYTTMGHRVEMFQVRDRKIGIRDMKVEMLRNETSWAKPIVPCTR